jgi:hypothetical protein
MAGETKSEREALIRITLNDEQQWNLLGAVICGTFFVLGIIVGFATSQWIWVPK